MTGPHRLFSNFCLSQDVASGKGKFPGPTGAKLICQRHLLEALQTTHPSLSEPERRRFETMCVRMC